jgi:hypothetical protein
LREAARAGHCRLGSVRTVHDPGAELALAMADLEANEDRYPEALQWLEVGAQRSPLPRSYRAKRDAWVTQARLAYGRHSPAPDDHLSSRLPAD